MELGPRDRLSQAFWHEQRKGRTIKSDFGDVVHLDIRHLGEKVIDERLPMVRELARAYVGVDPVYTRSEEHTSELQSLMRISYAVFCLKKKKTKNDNTV